MYSPLLGLATMIRLALVFQLLSSAVVVPVCLSQETHLGTVDFPTSGAPSAQPHFVRGVLFLHSFEYDSAAHEFREAQHLDPGFAMAYWGEAMTYTHPVWNQQDTTAAHTALSRLGPTRSARNVKATTAREKSYLDAVEILYGSGTKAHCDTLYSAAMEKLAALNPDDMEAQAFYALSLLGLNQGVRDLPAYMRAAAIAQEIFRRNPDHPGAAHYIIHAFDDPTHAPLGLYAARAYSQIAPGAAHAQHMTTHIFLAMGMWDEVVLQNEIASGHDHEQWMPGHYTEWLNYAYLQQGRYAEALQMLDVMRHHLSDKPSARQMAGLMVLRARYIIDTEKWNTASSWDTDAAQLPREAKAYWAFINGLGALKRGNREEGTRALAAYSAANVASGAKDPIDLVSELELKALIKLAAGAQEDAIGLMRQATAKEDAMPFQFGPPAIIKPSHELFGEMLLGMGRGKEAQLEFTRALTLAPRRARSLIGLAHASTTVGDKATAAEAYATLRAIWHRADAEELAQAR